MEKQQRFLNRLWLMERLDLWLREAVYHRTHEEAEKLPNVPVWNWDDDEGQANVVAGELK